MSYQYGSLYFIFNQATSESGFFAWLSFSKHQMLQKHLLVEYMKYLDWRLYHK